ncbi:TIGR04086 family membrane protein [Oceanobacillus profundus]|uniref:TIGR04086 family membrane protein n=1 Tax=Oceanobacillus profundus TaxID=372463 RepID=A0A417YJ12_9BACI|nr:TIGR04086 family membrane protein [Oceanobacillus profundus]MBR3118388.1 TIGR04086 family membrane protein [Oceanobacillus sp.]PAE31010.1 TIGR04086 family membrane protein [Paenibacillus sp. 7884-2]MCM3396957.1 TIGR04086 family membrane protein [Oceanobacillus profundus]MDO6448257.1 TIGR04086 family membrane protein [Oceanobacillus profundus]RHW33056.1 TIGR04086 family membrane protein [Oceanobacillus profundus]
MQKNQLTALLYGWIVVLGIILLSSVVLALVLQFTAFDEPGLKWTTLIIGILALFLGGITAGAKGKSKGWLIGTTIGLGFTLLIFLVQYLGYQQGFSLEQSIHHLGFLAAALVGGIIGVNLIGGQVE